MNTTKIRRAVWLEYNERDAGKFAREFLPGLKRCHELGFEIILTCLPEFDLLNPDYPPIAIRGVKRENLTPGLIARTDSDGWPVIVDYELWWQKKDWWRHQACRWPKSMAGMRRDAKDECRWLSENQPESSFGVWPSTCYRNFGYDGTPTGSTGVTTCPWFYFWCLLQERGFNPTYIGDAWSAQKVPNVRTRLKAVRNVPRNCHIEVLYVQPEGADPETTPKNFLSVEQALETIGKMEAGPQDGIESVALYPGQLFIEPVSKELVDAIK